MNRGPRFIGKYFIFVLVGVSTLVLSELSIRPPRRLAGGARAGLGFICFFLCSRQRRSPESAARVPGFEELGGCGPGERAGAWPGGAWSRGGVAWPRGGACRPSAAGGRVGGWRLGADAAATAAVTGSRRSGAPRAAAVLLAGAAPARPPPTRGRPRGALPENSGVSASGSPGKAKCSQVQPVSRSGPGAPAAG